MVFVHAPQLVGIEPEGLTAQAPRDQVSARRGDHEPGRHQADDARKAPHEVLGDPLPCHPDRHESDERAVVVNRRDGADRRSEAARVRLGERRARTGLIGVARVRQPDLLRHRMCHADALGVHDDDEVHPCRLADLLGAGLERCGRIGGEQPVRDLREERGCHCDIRHGAARGLVGVAAFVDDDERTRHDRYHREHHQLEDEQLARHAHRRSRLATVHRSPPVNTMYTNFSRGDPATTMSLCGRDAGHHPGAERPLPGSRSTRPNHGRFPSPRRCVTASRYP